MTARETPGTASVYFAVSEFTSADSCFGISFLSALSAPFFSWAAAARTPATRSKARDVMANDVILMDLSLWMGGRKPRTSYLGEAATGSSAIGVDVPRRPGSTQGS